MSVSTDAAAEIFNPIDKPKRIKHNDLTDKYLK